MDSLHEVKLDVKEIRKDISTIKETLASNTAHLAAHMARTDLNEKRIETVERLVIGSLVTGVLSTIGIILTKVLA